MKKSNIVLLLVFASLFSLIGFTRTALENKFRNQDVRVDTVYVPTDDVIPSDRVSVATPVFQHIVMVGSVFKLDTIIIQDSVLNDNSAEPMGLIRYRSYHKEEVNHVKQFAVRNDTLFIDLNAVSSVVICSNGLKSLNAGNTMWTRPIYVRSIHPDKLTLYVGGNNKVSLENCAFKLLDVTIEHSGIVSCDLANRVDTLNCVIGSGGSLLLRDFKGEIGKVSIRPNGNLQCVGSSIKAFANVKWD